MMKRFYISFIALIQATLLLGHGFSTDTLVLLADNTWQQISTVCYRTQKKKIAVASYDTTALYQTTSKTTCGGRSKSHCFIRFGFDEQFKDLKRHEVACTPTQEFYNAKTHQWVPAYKLKVGDELLCANNATKRVVYITLIKESLDICTIQVKHTHTFFVTQHSLLTHNMVIPVAFSLGMSIPFGASAGGATGGFFGPITFVVGAAIGCAVGALVKFVCNSKIPTYSVEAYNVNDFEQHVRQQPQFATLSEPQVVLSPDYVATKENVQQPESLSASAMHVYHDDNDGPDFALEATTGRLLFSTTIVNLSKEKPGCGDATPQKPLILITPVDPMPVFQNPGHRPLSDEERKMLSGGCTLIPIPEQKKEDSIISSGIVPISIDASDIIMAAKSLDQNPRLKDECNEQYNGPTYNRTEDWIKNHLMPEEANELFERTNLGMQGKRAYRLKKKVGNFTGIFQGEYVVIDALHKDHLEVYDKYGRWSHVANFDGSKNEAKTEQAKNGSPREKLNYL